MGGGATDGKWCILRTSGAGTLGVAAALVAGGIDAWTPQAVVKRRRPRSKVTSERDAPILPTFVFVRAEALPELRAALAQPVNPFPSFSIFHYAGRIPLISEASMASLRREEERAAERHARDAGRVKRLAHAVGDTVKVNHGAFTGLTGVVEEGRDKHAVVNFGRGLRITIAAWHLESGQV